MDGNWAKKQFKMLPWTYHYVIADFQGVWMENYCLQLFCKNYLDPCVVSYDPAFEPLKTQPS